MSKYNLIAAYTGLTAGEAFFFLRLSETIVDLGYDAHVNGTSHACELGKQPSLQLMYDTFYHTLEAVNSDIVHFHQDMYKYQGTEECPF